MSNLSTKVEAVQGVVGVVKLRVLILAVVPHQRHALLNVPGEHLGWP